MDKGSAKKLIADIFSKEFERSKFIDFTNTLLYSAHFDPTLIKNKDIPDLFKDHIESVEILASFEDSREEQIDLLIVTLFKDTALDRARTMQRNYVAQYLKNQYKDAALVAFVCKESPHWRFSLIKLESSISGINITETITPAKRWSFLVGKDEGSHTAQSQLVNILANDTQAPELEDLEHAFNIETVTNEFFTQYTELFYNMKEKLDELIECDEKLKKDFKDKEVDTSDFAKKTMGQIAFLYFLQKKGWFGVEAGKEWGTGVKNFLRKVFEKKKKYGENFFNDILEPLFYEALAQDRGNEAIYPKLNNCRVPFLNGGLFEPMNNYSWQTTNILLPDELFSNNNMTAQGDCGDGILDIFDRYNFTVIESEPLDKEVAIDPEMLGKVFENLLEKRERGDKGAFYTPREIVHFMCQESLINYLDSKIKEIIPKEDIESFIKQVKHNNHNDRSIDNIHKGESGSLIPRSCIKHANEIDNILSNIKVCDPAVGSGAFPLGMLNEIVSARKLINVYLQKKISTYDLKYHAIANSIYGVDLDPGAVEIAKLRLWLSLIVEEKTPTPLPNLEHKIMQGNSLLSSYQGIELFDDNFLNSTKSINKEKSEIREKLNSLQNDVSLLVSNGEFNADKKIEIDKKAMKLSRRLKFLIEKNIDKSETGDLFNEDAQTVLIDKKIKILQSKMAEYISPERRTVKENLKLEIDNLKWDLIEATLFENSDSKKLLTIKQQRKDRIKQWFIWKLEFSEVFKNHNGFDIVIGNPPYLRVQGIEKNISETYKKLYKSATGSYDLYVLFVERGLNLLSDDGILNYIMPHKWVNSSFGKGLRSLCKDNIRKLISFEAYQVFNASTYTSLAWFDKTKSLELNYLGLEKDLHTNQELKNFLISLSDNDFTSIKNKKLTSNTWVLTNKKVKNILDKINKQPLKVSDIFERIFTGLQTSKDSVYFLSDIAEKDDLILEGFSKELDKRILIEKGLVKTLLKGDDVHRYQTLTSNKVVIFPYYISSDSNQDRAILFTEEELKYKFPQGYLYLKECEDVLRRRETSPTYPLGKLANDDYWFKYIYPKNLTMFNEEKLITPYLSLGSQFSFDPDGDFYTNTKCFGLIKYPNIAKSYKFYLSILNSKLMWFFIKNTSSVMSGGYYTFTKDSLSPFPLPETVNIKDIESLEKLVEKIFENKKLKIDTENLECQVNKLVFELYGLNDEEIEFIESC